MAEMTSEKSMTSMDLDQAVVRVKWPDAESRVGLMGPQCWIVNGGSDSFHMSIAAAWANAADKVIEAAGYLIDQPSASGLWYWMDGNEDNTATGCASRALALESAKRDYIQRNRVAPPVDAESEEAKPDAAGEALSKRNQGVPTEAANRKLRDALENYGEHIGTCPAPFAPCVCGLDAALAAHPQDGKDEEK